MNNLYSQKKSCHEATHSDIMRGLTPSFFMQEVKVIDNFLSEEEHVDISNYVNGIRWTMQVSNTNTPGLHFLYGDVCNVDYFNTHLFRGVKSATGMNVKVSQVYFNGQWPGREGEFHRDPCDLTALIYVSKCKPQWGGFTQILLDDGREVVVSPKERRMIIFPGKCLHKGYAFSYQSCPMRVSLAYKLDLC